MDDHGIIAAGSGPCGDAGVNAAGPDRCEALTELARIGNEFDTLAPAP